MKTIAFVLVSLSFAGASRADEAAEKTPKAAACRDPARCWQRCRELKVDPKVSHETRRACYKEGCEAGSTPACVEYGHSLFYGLGGSFEREQGRSLFVTACDGGNLEGCANLGIVQRDHDQKKGILQAEKLFAASCEKGHMRSCVLLGKQYSCGGGGQTCGTKQATQPPPFGPDYTRARALFEKACGAGHANGCRQIGAMYKSGIGIEASYHMAENYYQRACDMGHSYACEEARYCRRTGEIFRNNRPRP